MNIDELEVEIKELIDLPVQPKSEWVQKFECASESAISGAILHWSKSGGIVVGADSSVNKREAAAAILQSRLTSKVTSTMEQLDKSASKISTVGLILAIVGVVIGVIQILK
jgi:hypothetical protein